MLPENGGIRGGGENPHTAIITIWVFGVTFEMRFEIRMVFYNWPYLKLIVSNRGGITHIKYTIYYG